MLVFLFVFNCWLCLLGLLVGLCVWMLGYYLFCFALLFIVSCLDWFCCYLLAWLALIVLVWLVGFIC